LLRVLYFGTYDREVGRNAIMIGGLRRAGAEVDECHARVWQGTEDKLRVARDWRSDAEAALRLVRAWTSLALQHRSAAPYDVMVVGSTGHLDVPLARRLARSRGRPLVFDPLVSVAETVRDRSLLPHDSRRLTWIRSAERRVFRAADLVVADTAQHADFFAESIGVSRERLVVVPAGAPAAFRSAATPYEPAPRRPLVVGYYGQYIPLHGLETVLAAAARLRDRQAIRFELVGRGQMLQQVQAEARRLGLTNVSFVETWLPPERLAREHLARADLTLGAFGRQPKAMRVVPFKVYAGLASGRAVVTARTPALDELLASGREVWTVPPADDAALAGAVARLADDAALRSSLAAAGQAAYDQRFSPQVLGRRFAEALETLVREGRVPSRSLGLGEGTS
jgi:glycosyltransferase involved in cell wall biosynthesis